MNYCDDCKLLDLCGLEGSCDDALTFCSYKSEFISRGVIEDIKREIAELHELYKVNLQGFSMSVAKDCLEIIDKHIGKESK